MADFCMQCSGEMFGKDFSDLSGLCESDQQVMALCEGCGFVDVDHEGKRVGPAQLLQHQCGGWMELDLGAESKKTTPPEYQYNCRSCKEVVWSKGQ